MDVRRRLPSSSASSTTVDLPRSLLRLTCGSGAPGGPVTLGYTVNATPYGFVADPRAVDPGEVAHVGLIAQEGQAVFDNVALFLAR